MEFVKIKHIGAKDSVVYRQICDFNYVQNCISPFNNNYTIDNKYEVVEIENNAICTNLREDGNIQKFYIVLSNVEIIIRYMGNSGYIEFHNGESFQFHSIELTEKKIF